MSRKNLKRAFCCATTLVLMFALLLKGSNVAMADARASYDWCGRIEQFQRVNAAYTNKRPALTMIVQNFLTLYDTEWCDKIVSAGGMDGYFGTTTRQCVSEYQNKRGLSADGDVWHKTWWQIGYDLLDEGPTYGCFFFTYDGGYVLRALSTSPYTFYYPTFDYGDMQWNLIPKYPD